MRKTTGQRKVRLERQIQQILSLELMSSSKDPDLQLITIVAVELTGDLHDAKVYFSPINGEKEDESLRALNRSKGRLRSTLARELQTRVAPTIEFVPDHLYEQVTSIDNLLAKVAIDDAKLAAARAGKDLVGDYANGDSPYKEKRVKIGEADNIKSNNTSSEF